MSFKKAELTEIRVNPFTKISKEWFLLTAGNAEKYNTMTASWGALGEIWGRHTATAYVRHSRHTLEYMDNNELFTICFFDESMRSALSFCGSHSGRDCDKASETGLTVTELDGAAAFVQAREVFVCRKLYTGELDESGFTDKAVEGFYADKDYHRMFIGEIVSYFVNDGR